MPNRLNRTENYHELFGGKNFGRDEIGNYMRWINHALVMTNPAYKHAFFKSGQLAPSVISRADLNLVGGSRPRFSLRAYVGDSFYNLRRLSMLMDAFKENGHGASTSVFGPGEFRILGDCLLELPASAPGAFHYVTSDKLWGLYGLFERQRRPRTCYVQFFEKYGSCAHAVTFMASMLLHTFSRRVGGLNEIGTGNELTSTFALGGASLLQLREYLRQDTPAPGIQLFVSAAPPLDLGGPEIAHVGPEDATTLVRHYVLSGFPVGLPVHYDRFFRVAMRCVGRRLKPDLTPEQLEDFVDTQASSGLAEEDNCQHLVLCVGATVGSGPAVLSVHDPSTIPYATCTSRDLEETASSIFLRRAPREPGARSYKFYYAAYVPAAVRVDLGSKLVSNTEVERSSLSILTNFEKLTAIPAFTDFLGLKEDWLGQDADVLRNSRFRLVQLSEVVKGYSSRSVHFEDFLSEIGGVEWRTALHARAIARPDHWVWVQWYRLSSTGEWRILVWDAQEHHLARQDVNLPVFVWSLPQGNGDGGHEVVVPRDEPHPWTEAPGQAAASTQAATSALPPHLPWNLPTTGGEPKVALVTSFSARSYAKGLAFWPPNVRYAELYAFMRGDLFHFRDHRTGPIRLPHADPSDSVCKVMASLRGKPEILREIATAIDSDFKPAANGGLLPPACSHQVLLSGISSFVPEIFSPIPEVAERGRDAFHSILQIGDILRKQFRHPLARIQLVAGSRIDHSAPSVPQGGAHQRNLLSLEEFFKRHKTTFEWLNQCAQDTAENGHEALRLAFEAEPGNCYLLGTVARLAAFCGKIRNMSNLSVNFDLGHFQLMTQFHSAKNDLNRFQGTARFSGIHLSLHAVGHLADIPYTCAYDLQPRSVTRPPDPRDDYWREILTSSSSLMREFRNSGMDLAEGMIPALELEAIQEPGSLTESVRIVQALYGF